METLEPLTRSESTSHFVKGEWDVRMTDPTIVMESCCSILEEMNHLCETRHCCAELVWKVQRKQGTHLESALCKEPEDKGNKRNFWNVLTANGIVGHREIEEREYQIQWLSHHTREELWWHCLNPHGSLLYEAGNSRGTVHFLECTLCVPLNFRIIVPYWYWLHPASVSFHIYVQRLFWKGANSGEHWGYHWSRWRSPSWRML